jgi:hypothetical protein
MDKGNIGIGKYEVVKIRMDKCEVVNIDENIRPIMFEIFSQIKVEMQDSFRKELKKYIWNLSQNDYYILLFIKKVNKEISNKTLDEIYTDFIDEKITILFT